MGRLDPCEAVEWQEWWYPVHGIGGFTFANKNLAVNASQKGDSLELRIAGTGTWKGVEPVVCMDGREVTGRNARFDITPAKPVTAQLPGGAANQGSRSVQVLLRHGTETLAQFDVPLRLPERKRPDKKPDAETPSQIVERGWQDFLFARYPEAEAEFQKALQKDSHSVGARTGLAYLRLDSDPAAAVKYASEALEVQPDCGLARQALAVAQSRTGALLDALDNAWKASLDPATAVAGRALAAKLLLQQERFMEAVNALSGPGPWASDPLCRDRLALALHRLGREADAIVVARQTLQQEPLDAIALCVLWLAKAESEGLALGGLVDRNPVILGELLAEFSELGLKQPEIVSKLKERFCRDTRGGDPGQGEFPYRLEMIPELRAALKEQPGNGTAALALGHLLFHAGRHAEGRGMWQKAAELGAEPVIAYRALGMASLTLDNDSAAAVTFLRKAHELDKADAIVARDLARVVFRQADGSDASDRKHELLAQARDTLKSAFASGKTRADFVALLGRAQNRLGEFDQTARMLDSVRVTVWEGSREVHDLFQDAHLELGKAQLAANRPADALREFNRALDTRESRHGQTRERSRGPHPISARQRTFRPGKEGRGSGSLAARGQ